MIKKRLKNVLKISMAVGIVFGLVGCGDAGSLYNKNEAEPVFASSISNDAISVDESLTNKDKNDSGLKTENEDIPMVKLPKGIEGSKSEKKINKELRNLIINFYEIPEDFFETTRYYYNYVDLNEDGNKEIFVIVTGPYTSGTGGSSAMWVVESAGQLHVNQDFSIVNTPVIVSDVISNGVHELVVPYCGGGIESQYSILKYSNGEYSRVSDSKTVKTLDGISGKAILANDFVAEIQAGKSGHTLLEK